MEALSDILKNSVSAFTVGGGGGGSLQFQEEGVNVGTAGQATTVNFTGEAVTASISTATLTVDVNIHAAIMKRLSLGF